ncbi:MAG TPA: DNA polymerase I, partial [Elusimicrobiota bacterium]|nr:DNA polymerase I [Elusimicrobiota bacterium]
LDPFACALVGIALATRPGEAWYVPVGHRGLGEPPSWPLEKIRPVLGPPLSDPKLPKVGQNLKFDGHVLERHGLPLVGVSFDTLVASYCLNPSRPNHGLKTLALDLLGESMTPIENLIGSGAKALTMDQVPVERAALYAGADAEVTLRLKALMEKDLRDHRMDRLFHDVEMPLVGILSDMETAGLCLNVPYLQKLSREFGESLAGLEKEIHGLAGETFNVNSPKQLAVVLFEKLKLPVLRKTKPGYSTDEEVLQTLSDRHPLPARVVAYRELAKLKSTYVDGLLELVDPQTHRVHTRLNQAVAATGRLSSSDPNLQNIPIRTDAGRKIRRAFVPSEGNVFLSADYSQIDLRVLAHMSGDPALVRAFRRGEDVHAATARDIFDLGPDAPVTDDQRRVAKSVNFGIVYGQTPFGLSQQLKIPLPQAQEYIRRYLEKYAGVQAWVEATLERARRDGYVTTLLHRRRYLPEINASNGNVRAFAERTAMNTPIQGTSADIIKVAMREVTAWMAKHGGRARLLLQVHDDLLFDVPRGELAALAPAVRRLMESAVPLDVPVVVDLKTGPNWADMKKGEPAA